MPASTHAMNLAMIKKVYLLLETNFSRLFKACSSEQEREMLRNLHDSARDAFWKAVASNLIDNNETVQAIRDDLRKATAKVEKELKSLKNIAALLAFVSEAVRLAGSLTTLASA